jgi:GAF domain-containing protein
MAETTLDVRHLPKIEAYRAVQSQLDSMLEGLDDEIAAMATMSSVLHQGFGFLWTGFYRVVAPSLLRVGPYQGSPGCLEIAFARGVCGQAARERRTVIVPDVDAFAGHITCDARSKSEIVVPVLDAGGALVAVLDVDSERAGSFDDDDARGLERAVAWFAARHILSARASDVVGKRS